MVTPVIDDVGGQPASDHTDYSRDFVWHGLSRNPADWPGGRLPGDVVHGWRAKALAQPDREECE